MFVFEAFKILLEKNTATKDNTVGKNKFKSSSEKIKKDYPKSNKKYNPQNFNKAPKKQSFSSYILYIQSFDELSVIIDGEKKVLKINWQEQVDIKKAKSALFSLSKKIVYLKDSANINSAIPCTDIFIDKEKTLSLKDHLKNFNNTPATAIKDTNRFKFNS